MISYIRNEVFFMMNKYKNMLEPEHWDVLDVGVAGDPPRPDGKPGGNYRFFGENNNYKTLDKTKGFNPDYVDDICHTSFKNNTWDLVILSQTLEHIFTPKTAIEECYRIIKKDGFFIVDSPWMFRYHPENDYDDYYRYSVTCLKEMCKMFGFKIIDSNQTNLLSSLLAQKI